MTYTDNLSPAPAWAAGSKEIQLGPPAGTATAVEVIDRLLIAETANRYAWAYDERALDVLGACFTSDGTFCGSVAGTSEIAPVHGRDAVVDWLAGHMESQSDQRRHGVTNLVIQDQQPSTATALSYLVLAKAENGASTLVCTGVYRFSMVKETDGVWRIRELWAGFDTPF